MTTKKYLLIFLIVIYVSSILSFFKPEVLLYPLKDDPYFPLGTLTAWFSLSMGSIIAFVLFKKYFRSIPLYFIILICTSVVLGLSWGFASRIASGNWAFNYDYIPVISKNMKIYTYLTATLQLFTLAAIPLLLNWIKRKGVE